jgi:hypothetical protein
MLKNLRQFTFWLTLIGAVSCCKHDTEPSPCECGEVNSIEELKEWAFFKEGTYWIYEEENTGARDTLTVVNSHDFITDQGNVQFDYETHRSGDGYYYWFWFNEGWTSDCGAQNCCRCRTLWCDKYISGDADGEERLFRFPNFVGNYTYISVGLEEGLIEVIELFDTYCLANECFENVVKSNNSLSVLDQAPTTNEYYSVTYYFSKSIGIIRKEIQQTSEIWNLIEYQITQ